MNDLADAARGPAWFMIMGSFDRIATETAHNHANHHSGRAGEWEAGLLPVMIKARILYA